MPPTGFKRSRALWDNARRHSSGEGTTAGARREKFSCYARAILYELQPVRASELPRFDDAWTRYLRAALDGIRAFAAQTFPTFVASSLRFLKQRTKRQWAIAGAILAYYGFVRYVHYLLDAGPIVMILTALAAIFTFGLGDNGNEDGISAYSVFNRGFQRMLGTIDSDALVAQHVGGGIAGLGGGGIAGLGFDHDNDDPPRRQMQRADPRPAAAAAARADGDFGDDDDSSGDDDDGDRDNNATNNTRGGARISGKKARSRQRRRDNQEQRLDMQRQREAAMALGFADDDVELDAAAMQRLLDMGG